jgi:hypothetical protein
VAVHQACVDRHEPLDRIDDAEDVKPQIQDQGKARDRSARDAEDRDLAGRDLHNHGEIETDQAACGSEREPGEFQRRADEVRRAVERKQAIRRADECERRRWRPDREEDIACDPSALRVAQRVGVHAPVDADDAANAVEGEAEGELDGRQEGYAHDGEERGFAVDDGDDGRGGDLDWAERQFQCAAIAAIGQPHERAAAGHPAAEG